MSKQKKQQQFPFKDKWRWRVNLYTWGPQAVASEFQTELVFNVPLRDKHVKDFKQKRHAFKKKKRRKWLLFDDPCSNDQVSGLLFGFKYAPGDFVPLWNKQERARQIKTKAKSQTQGREFQPCIRVHRFHSCGKERHCKDEEGKTIQREQEKEQQPFAGSTLPLMFSYKLKILFQIITFQTLKVIWQLTLNIEFSSHSIHNLECDRGTWESRLPRGPQCVSLMPLCEGGLYLEVSPSTSSSRLQTG